MNLGPKKDGSPNIDFFQSSESLQGFESVRSWLQKNSKKVSEKKSEKNGWSFMKKSFIDANFLFLVHSK